MYTVCRLAASLFAYLKYEIAPRAIKAAEKQRRQKWAGGKANCKWRRIDLKVIIAFFSAEAFFPPREHT